jgi:heptosyltransferase-2
MKVLVIQNKMIGDVLTSTVICETIKKHQPNWEIHYMIQPNTLAVVENNPFIDKIVFFESQKHKGLFKLISFGNSLASEKYDAVIDAYGKWESILPAYFCGAKIRIGFKKWYTSLLFTTTVIQEKNIEGSAVYHRLQLVEELLKTKTETIFPKIYLTDTEINEAKIAMKKRLDPALKIIMISVLGSGKSKSLPPEKMAETLNIIAEENVQLLFNFMPNQQDEAKVIYDLCKPQTQQKIVFDFYTKGLRAFLAVLSQCDALIGNEGGAVNMAKALNIKTFTIFSPWINKSSWNMLSDKENHIAVHLKDYFPDIYKNKHPKEFKYQSLELYNKFDSNLYKELLQGFVKRISL